jgi:DNA-binding transcriptional MerR regulator
MAVHATVGYLSADVIADTGVSESYLSFLVRNGIVRPLKHRNGRTNVFSFDDIELVRWAMARRGDLSIEEMRVMVTDGIPR